MWVAIPLDVILALGMMKLAAFGEMKEGVKKQFAIFGNKHTWSLTALYIVTFSSFIGFSMALPLAITVIFGFQHVPGADGVMQHMLKNPNAPSALTYAWIGPFLGAAVRPLGGWISDKVGGSIVTPGHLGGDGGVRPSDSGSSDHRTLRLVAWPTARSRRTVLSDPKRRRTRATMPAPRRARTGPAGMH